MPCIGCVRYRKVTSRGSRELGTKNDVLFREMFAIKCPLHRGLVMRV